MSEAKSIKESLEVLEGLKVVGVCAKQVFKDGKVNLADAPAALELLNKLSVITAAVQGADQVPAEMKDLSSDEVNQLAAKALEIVAALRAS